jgi:hypothetical protein
MFFNVHVFMNADPGVIKVPSGTVSATNWARWVQSGAVGEIVAVGCDAAVPFRFAVVLGFAVGTSKSFDIVQLGVGNLNVVGVDGSRAHPPRNTAASPIIPKQLAILRFIRPP